ncbi:response regulator [Erythrobacter gaetbuli]|uniref:Response regulator n=1 Tax=Qipengyuania gaetbuli TaxID=266952 RepID=A0A844XXZ8_9SPHN|nr:response regulator [Qipengyuania gaetbuli]MXO50875.1 response regulator [Qipengyuania gaetbuli]
MKPSILIIEDEFLISAEMEEVIRDLGYVSAGTADDLESALSLASDEIDVALVDVNLADGATGPEIGARLAREYDMQVVFVTANPQQLSAGVPGTLGAVEKPVDLRVLDEVLEFAFAYKRGLTPTPPPRLQMFQAI